MKNILFLGLAVVGIALASCNKNDVSPTSTSATLSNAAAATDSMKNGGRPPKLDSVVIGSLPTAITSYITTNYAGATIKHAGKDKDGNYVVAILVNNSPKGLLFDSKGAFVKVLPPPPADGPDGQGGPKPDSIAVSSLPNTITNYITQNYAGATIKRAGKDKDGNYIVGILVNDQRKGLVFDATGTFKEEVKPPMGQEAQGQNPPQLTEVAINSLPATITDYITKNYTGAEIKQAGTDKEGNYIVGILLNNQPKGLVFNSKGTFKEEAKLPPKRG